MDIKRIPFFTRTTNGHFTFVGYANINLLKLTSIGQGIDWVGRFIGPDDTTFGVMFPISHPDLPTGTQYFVNQQIFSGYL